MSDSALSTDAIRDKILKCDRCDRKFDCDDRIPRVLPCQHSYCTRCLEDIWRVGSKLSCPSCGQLWDVKDSVSETFSVEFVAMKSVVSEELKDNRGRRLCTDCSERAPATHYCLSCQLYICEEGLRSHKRFKKTKDHKVMAIDSIMTGNDVDAQQKNGGSQLNETCVLHTGSVLDLYCEKSTCMTAVCPSCAMIQHKERDGHEIRDLKEVVSEEQREVSRSMEALQRRRDQDNADRKELETELVFLNTESRRLEANIEKHFGDFIRQATEQKQDLRDTLRDVFVEERQQINACVKTFNLMGRAGQDYLTYCRTVMAEPKPTRFLEERFEMKHQLETLCDTPRPEFPERREVFVDLASLNDLMNKMARIGEVIYLDHLTLEWKCLVEITDCYQGENQLVVKVLMQYTGQSNMTPIAPYVKAVVEDASGHVTRTSLSQLDLEENGMGDPQREVVVDSSRSYDDRLGVISQQERKGTFDIDRYQEAGSPRESGNDSRKQSLSNRKQRGQRTNDPQADSKTSLNGDVVFNSLDTDQPGSEGELSRSGATMPDSEVVSQLYFRPRLPGPHKLNFRIGGYPVFDDNLIFNSCKPGEAQLDRSVHFLTWKDEHDVGVKTLKLPHISLSQDKLNRGQCTITSNGKLIKSPSASPSDKRDSTAFSNYCGTVGTRSFSGEGYHYWHVACSVRVLARVASFGKMILEAAVAHGDVLDKSYCVWETPRAWSLVVSICSTHKAICVKVVSNSKVLYDSPIMECEEDAFVELELGVLLDTNRGRCTFLDGKTNEVMWSFDGLDTSKSLWPVFGVYNRFHFSVELGVTSGEKLEMNADELRVVEGLL